jgi:hypothetical protein
MVFIEMKVIPLLKMKRSACQQTRGTSSTLKNSIPKTFNFFIMRAKSKEANWCIKILKRGKGGNTMKKIR